ncbi:hypothetical protein DPX16_5303 [Anabarilius grahami]|uniref:Uncharacterized protein n=1 Tax=Anabarilius grahami TaxID=495550 RepID=A0A3N0XU19_ANAGA|nr:hypothetical protein DPX16_5303 [Anabarilius grahami]
MLERGIMGVVVFPSQPVTQSRVLWELNESAGAIDNERRVRHTARAQQSFYYAAVAASAFSSQAYVGLVCGLELSPSRLRHMRAESAGIVWVWNGGK